MAKQRVIDKLMDPVHQGDVGIIKISNTPQLGNTTEQLITAKRGKELIIQHGEALGHYHTIYAPEKVKLKLLSLDEGVRKMQMDVFETVNLNHEEHGTIAFTPGSYLINTQREFSRGLARSVRD